MTATLTTLIAQLNEEIPLNDEPITEAEAISDGFPETGDKAKPFLPGRNVSDETFIAALRGAVAAKPNFIYEPSPVLDDSGEPEIGYLTGEPLKQCTYLKKDGLTGDCGVGVALIASGVNPEWLKHREGGSAYSLMQQLGYSRPTLLFADSFQSDQDTGVSWAQALADAEHKLGNATS
ncbi:hypothetical protein SEA_SEPHIROTH_46 [Gordonia Phage Sephiroth]|uniref:Uncharacterized protein n=1 Tax=Gordonia Phage Sephiroth TaxID=2767553 RepID=A0A7G9UZD4_9CAUD|nr:hypothetical protein L3Y23_gp046 [Gordonia Phage Sephiroth]QNN99389.1 hypothetical protein SEA_SEPHIROTH_46 [Gordonia Phage Sephiroth]